MSIASEVEVVSVMLVDGMPGLLESSTTVHT